MEVTDMGPLHPELLIKEEKMFVISDVMGETEFFGRTEGQELASVPEVSINVRWDSRVHLLLLQYVPP
jgi:hypothetical protein